MTQAAEAVTGGSKIRATEYDGLKPDIQKRGIALAVAFKGHGAIEKSKWIFTEINEGHEDADGLQARFESCALDLRVRNTIPVASKHLRYHVLPAQHMFQFQEILIELFRPDFQITPATKGRCAIFRSQSSSV